MGAILVTFSHQANCADTLWQVQGNLSQDNFMVIAAACPLYFEVIRSNDFKVSRAPIQYRGVGDHLSVKIRIGPVDDISCELGQKPGFEHGAGTVDAGLLIWRGGEQ